MKDCLFCKMADGTIQVPKIYEDAEFFSIRDIHPQAKHHLLVMPKRHVQSLAEAFPAGGNDEVELVGRLMAIGTRVARQQGLLPDGFRAVLNTKDHAGQTIHHIHLHILGGEPLGHFGS